ncbi:MAG: flagellar export chaperone FlgN [Spirochaetales bacterium]|nr:flagellar export chaperone FlgN [Spirochaetales bacterium]
MKELIEKLKECMSEELNILTNFSENEQNLKHNIEKHDWVSLEKTIKQMQPLSERIDLLDKERSDIFRELCGYYGEKENCSFYHIAVYFPHSEREICTSLYQELKIAVIRIQSITWSIDNYVRTVTGTIQQVLNNVYPHRKGNLYCSKGSLKQSTGIDPVLVNQQL